MTHAIGVRAASVATSAALLAIVTIAAFSVSITLQTPTDNGPVIPWFEPEPPTPPPTPPRETRPPRPLPQEPTVFDADPPPLPPVRDLTGNPTDLLAPVGPPEIANPRWLRQPRDLARYYPPRALARGITGQAVLDCAVDTVGALHCTVVSETPANWGFGAAALRIAADYRMVPAMREGRAVEGRYRMRVPFELR